jgi:hypothetical protein
MDEIPADWWVEHSGQSQVLDYEKVGRLIIAARAVIKQWPSASIGHYPMIEDLERLREALAPEA